MDGILSLFETVTLPNNHAFIFKDYLKICADHKVFVNKTAKDVKPIVSYINGKLNSATNRVEGLYMLQTFLPQCSKEVFQENALMWLHQCLKTGDGKSTQLTVLSYQLIKTLLQMTEQMPEMKRTINSLVVIKLVENLQHNIPSQSLLAMLECTETLMYNYGPACGQHKNVLEKILLQHIDSSDRHVVDRLARCMARLPQLSGAGPMGANHTGRWNQEQKRLCATLHGILDELFVFIEEDPNTFRIEITSTKLPLPEISNDSSLIKVFRLVNRFINVAEILRGLLVLKFPADKSVNPEAILQLVCRGLAVTDKSVSDSVATELLMTKALLPRIHIALLKILNSLIICAGRNLIPYGIVICKQVYQILSWTSTSKWTYSIEKPYGELRAAACNTLVLWLQTSQSGSCVERIADKLMHSLIPDINPGKAALMLIEEASPKKGSSKRLKKSATVERNNQITSESLGSEIHIADPKANSKVCRAALKVMQWVLLSSSTFISTVIHEKLQTITVNLLNEIQKTGKRTVLPVPYSESHCREELYKLLLMTTLNPHPLRPVPTNQTLVIFATGCLDTNSKVAATCKIGLGSLEKLISGTRPTQHFPTTVEEMLDSMNAQQEALEEQIEDEIEQVEEGEDEEENDDMVEEEEEEDEEEEEEEIEDELELPEIKVGVAVSLKPDKAAPEQMEIQEEEPSKKIENKKVQQPVEKPEANKKDDEDEVEVLSEDEEDWNLKSNRKGKLTAEDDEMMDDEEEEFASEEEDEEGLEDIDDEDLEDDYEDEDEDTEIESEGEAIEHKIVAHSKVVKSVPIEIRKKEVTISESKNNTQQSEVTQQLTENVNEVVLANTELAQFQNKVNLPSANNNEEKAKELDSSIEEVQLENVEPSNEILERSIEKNSEQIKEVVGTTTEEIEDISAKEEHITEKIDSSNQNEVEKERVVLEVPEFRDVEDEIVGSIVETKRQRMEYQENNQDVVEEIDDQDVVQEIDDQIDHSVDQEIDQDVVQEIHDHNVVQEIHDQDVNDQASDGVMHEDQYEEQMEEQNSFEGKDDAVQHQEENQNELPDASDKTVEEKDEAVTEEPVHEAEVVRNVSETVENELIKNDIAAIQSEIVHHEDDTILMPEVSDEIEKQDAQEEDGGDTEDNTCEKEVASEQQSDIPISEEHVLSDEVCTDKDTTVVDIGNSEARVTAVSEVRAAETENMQMNVNETLKIELNAAAQKMPHSPEDEDVEEPSRKKMKMDITATLTDGPKAVDSEISNVSADVKLNSTAEMSRAERILNGTATAADEITEEELIQSFVPELIKDD